MKLKIKDFDEAIKLIEDKKPKAAIAMIQKLEEDAKEDQEAFRSMISELEALYDDKAIEEEGENI